ncbi:MAG: addiction module protein [Fimbriiglobus sp.]
MTQLAADFPVDRLTVPERLDLLGRLWDSLLRDDQPPPAPAWHLDELRKRVAAADAAPDASIPLEDLRRELLGEDP